MTREEIKEELSDVILDLGGLSFSNVNSLLEEDSAVTFEGEDLIEIAEHFYNLPKKGLWNSEKVIEWLRNNSSKYMTEGINYPHYAYNSLVDDLTKAMEK